jgi:hypothetical protein
VLQQLTQDGQLAVDGLGRPSEISPSILVRSQISRRNLAQRLVTKKQSQRSAHLFPPGSHSVGHLRPALLGVLLDGLGNREGPELARLLGGVWRSALQLGYSLLLEGPRLAAVGGAQRFTVAFKLASPPDDPPRR